MKIAPDTSFVDQSGSGASSDSGEKEMTNDTESPSADGGTEEFTNDLSSPEFKCDDCPAAFSTSQELRKHNLEEHFSGEIEHPNGEKVTNCNKFGCEKKNAVGRPSSFTQEQLLVLRSNFSVNKYPSRADMMQIAEAVGQPIKKVARWYTNSRHRGMGKLPSRRKCPDCDEIISKFDSWHQFNCTGHKDLRKEEHEVENNDVAMEMRQEKVNKGQGDMSNLDNQPGEDSASQSELDDSYSDLRALLDSDPDSD